MANSQFNKLVEIMEKLRQECPWDKEQTHKSLRQYLLEEAYEVLEMLDQQNDKKLCEELGDLLLQVVFHAEIAKERKAFTIEDVIEVLNEKMIRRHPHVFGDVKAENSKEVLTNWEKIKRQEEGRKSVLDGVPLALSALLRAQRLQMKASKIGFDWGKIEDVEKKVKEEWGEFQEALKNGDPKKYEEEFGDLLFSLVNVARFVDISAEDALRTTTQKFIKRFTYVEDKLKQQGKTPENTSLEDMDQLWEQAKQIEMDH